VRAKYGFRRAWLRGFGNSGTDTVTSNAITIPSNASKAHVTFHLRMYTDETTSSTVYDKLNVRVLNSSGTVLGTLKTYTNLTARQYPNQYRLEYASLSAYKGQTIKLQFQGIEDTSNKTGFFVDEVQVPVVFDNLALGATVTASMADTGSAAAYANDGSAVSLWTTSATQGDAQWLRIDLGASKTIAGLRLRWDASYAKAYDIKTSSDGSTWTTIYSTTAGNGREDPINIPPRSARYVRLNLTAPGTTSGYALAELEVYGATVTPSKTVVDSTYGTVVYPYEMSASSVDMNWPNHMQPGNVADSNTGSRWGSPRISTAWMQIDMLDPKPVGRLKINWETAYATAYSITVSNDGINWTTVYSTTYGNGGLDDVSFPTTTARYVRLNCNSRAYTDYGYSIWELDVLPR
jgi:hypothetical protein